LFHQRIAQHRDLHDRPAPGEEAEPQETKKQTC
jgi:hypothetical protein